VLLIGYATQGVGPVGLADWLATIGRIIGAGLAVSVLYSAISLAISSITSRKAAASAAFVGLVIGTLALSAYLVEEGGQSATLGLLNLSTLPYEMVFRIFGEPSELTLDTGPELATGAVVGAYFAWLAVAVAIIWWRYRRIEATR
jgi:ABC-2 type transport system permease protein